MSPLVLLVLLAFPVGLLFVVLQESRQRLDAITARQRADEARAQDAREAGDFAEWEAEVASRAHGGGS